MIRKKVSAIRSVVVEDGTGADKVTVISSDKWFLWGKTEGAARIKMKAAPEGDGIAAYVNIYKYVMETTGLALSERLKREGKM